MIAFVVIAGFFPLRFCPSTLAATNCPWVSLGFATLAASNAVSSAAGVVLSLEAIPLKLPGVWASGGVAGFAATVGFAAGFGGAIVGLTFGVGFWASAVAEAAKATTRRPRPERNNVLLTLMRCLPGDRWAERGSWAPGS